MYTQLHLAFLSKKWSTKWENGREVDDFYCFDKKCRSFIESFDQQYHKYRKIVRGEPETHEYKIPDNCESFTDIFEILEPFDTKWI